MSKFGLICGGGYVAGKEIMVLELARGLQSSDRDIHLVVSSWNNQDFPGRLTEANLPFRMLPFGFISATLTPECLRMTKAQILKLPALLHGYRRFLRTEHPRKIVHTNWHHLMLLWSQLKPNRDLFWVHELIPNRRHYRALFRRLSDRLLCFVPVSHAVAESLRRIGIPDHKIHIIHNGLVDPALSVERAHGSNGSVRVGIAGQVGAWKGHEDLLDAFSLIASRWPNTELHIFGQGADDYEQQLRQQVTALGVAEQIKWHGFVKKRADIFSNLEICVVPSRCEEALGMVAIEAASFGLPVVATKRGGLPEIIEDGVTGILVPAENPAKLADAIQRLLADPGLRQTMGARARQRVIEHFSRERFVKEFLELLESPDSPRPEAKDKKA